MQWIVVHSLHSFVEILRASISGGLRVGNSKSGLLGQMKIKGFYRTGLAIQSHYDVKGVGRLNGRVTHRIITHLILQIPMTFANHPTRRVNISTLISMTPSQNQ
jgi:hypothetical protein